MSGSLNERGAKCLRCGAPANARARGGELRRVSGLPARGRYGRSRSSTHDTRRARPYGYVHVDAAFCRQRMPNARRRPQDRGTWGSF